MSVKRVPEHIKRKMHRVAALHQQSSKVMNEIECWLEKNGIDTSTDGLRDGCGTGLDELEYGNDCVDDICERIENFDTWVPPDVFAKEELA